MSRVKKILSQGRWRIIIGGGIALLLIVTIIRLAFFSWICKPTQPTGATWQNITIGKSGRDDVVAELGPPDRIGIGFGGLTYKYYLDAGAKKDDLATPRIVFRRGTVVRIDDNIIDTERLGEVCVSDFVERYGIPDYVTWASTSPGFPRPGGFDGLRIVIFLDDGVILLTTVGISSIHDAFVFHAIYIQPCSLTCAHLKYPYWAREPERLCECSGYIPEIPWDFTTGILYNADLYPCCLLPDSER